MPQRVLIAYYTRSGNTRKIAETIRATVRGDMYVIEPQNAYPPSYNAVVQQAKKQIQAGERPTLRTGLPDVAGYDLVFVGSPNWWGTIAPPVATFLAGCDLAGKTVAPFCTHGGGGEQRVARDIAKLCPRSNLLKLLVVNESGGTRLPAAVAEWLREIGVVVHPA